MFYPPKVFLNGINLGLIINLASSINNEYPTLVTALSNALILLTIFLEFSFSLVSTCLVLYEGIYIEREEKKGGRGEQRSYSILFFPFWLGKSLFIYLQNLHQVSDRDTMIQRIIHSITSKITQAAIMTSGM